MLLEERQGPLHLANRRYRLLGLRIAFVRRTTPDRKHTQSWFVALQPGASLECSMDHIIEARSAVARIRSQSEEHWTPAIRTPPVANGRGSGRSTCNQVLLRA